MTLVSICFMLESSHCILSNSKENCLLIKLNQMYCIIFGMLILIRIVLKNKTFIYVFMYLCIIYVFFSVMLIAPQK